MRRMVVALAEVRSVWLRFASLLSVALVGACGGRSETAGSPSPDAAVMAPPAVDSGAEASAGGRPEGSDAEDGDSEGGDSEGGDSEGGEGAETPSPGGAAASGASRCATSEQCTLVADSCGRIHGVPISEPTVLAAGPCARRKQTRVRPQCIGGRCEAAPIEDPDWYSCKSAADCTTMQWPCACTPVAVARVHKAEAERVAANNAANRSCRQPPIANVTPTVACLFNACVTR